MRVLTFLQPPTTLHPRFGVAVAKTRTAFQKQHKRQAARFLRQAIKQESESVSNNPRLNKFWIDQANLEPILTFLSKQ